MGVEGQSGLNSDEEALDVKGLEHNLSDLFSVFRSVHRRFSEDESMVLRLALEVVVDGSMPVLLDTFPVANLTSPQYVLEVVALLVAIGLITDVIVE